MTVQYSEDAKKQLKKLDKHIAGEIKKYMDEVQALKDPRSRGRELTSNLAGLWRYRAADFRIICEIQDDKLVILVLVIGDRKQVYR